MVQMKQSAAGSADMGMMEDLQLAVSLHRLDDALTVLWANTAFYQMLGKSRKILRNPLCFLRAFPILLRIIKRCIPYYVRQISTDSVR